MEEVSAIGFAHVGRNVKISTKASIYGPDQMVIGDNVRIDDFCLLSGKITLGRNVHIAVACHIFGGSEGVELGDFAGLSFCVNVFTQSDDYSGAHLTNPTVPEKYTGVHCAPVVIGRHAIIGANALVFPGVSIAEGCSVGAMALVNKSTEPWGVYVGQPARRVKDRGQGLLALEQAYLRESAHE